MRTAATATALGITLSIAALASCANPRPGEMPVPTPSVTPVFASEEEALAAAGDAYQRYLDVFNTVAQSGWVDASPLKSVERGDALERDLDLSDRFAKAGERQLGAITFDSAAVQQVVDGGAGNVSIALYLCADVSSVDVVDSNGVSVVSPDRQDRQALEVEFDDTDEALKISRSEVWSGSDFC